MVEVLIAGSGNQHDIEVAIGLLVFTAIELKWSPLKRFKDHRAKFYFGKELWTWAMLSSGVCVWFFLNLVLFVRFNGSLVTQRVFNFGPQPLGAGYWLTWLVIAVVVTRWGWDNIASGVMVMGLVGSIHEWLWYVFYTIAYPSQLLYDYYYSPFMVLMVALVVCYFLLSRHGSIRSLGTERIIMMIAMVVAFNSVWLAGGFPVSIFLDGPGPLFGNVLVGIIETLSWVTLGVVAVA